MGGGEGGGGEDEKEGGGRRDRGKIMGQKEGEGARKRREEEARKGCGWRSLRGRRERRSREMKGDWKRLREKAEDENNGRKEDREEKGLTNDSKGVMEEAGD